MPDQRFLEPHERPRPWSWSGRADARGAEASDATTGPGSDDEDLDAGVYVISVAADLAELHPQTLRAYEREGLLTPSRTSGGTRRYSRRDVERLRLIRRLTQDEGLNIAGVRLVLDLGEKLEGSRRRITELEEVVRALAARIEEPPRRERFEIVRAEPAPVEVHRSSRRTASRSANARPVQRARPLPPPELRGEGRGRMTPTTTEAHDRPDRTTG
jgi:MerR family transcriptional regulator/heat shock protein HspR